MATSKIIRHRITDTGDVIALVPVDEWDGQYPAFFVPDAQHIVWTSHQDTTWRPPTQFRGDSKYVWIPVESALDPELREGTNVVAEPEISKLYGAKTGRITAIGTIHDLLAFWVRWDGSADPTWFGVNRFWKNGIRPAASTRAPPLVVEVNKQAFDGALRDRAVVQDYERQIREQPSSRMSNPESAAWTREVRRRLEDVERRHGISICITPEDD